MESLDILRLSLLSPMTLSFALGVAATLLRSDLKFPDQLYTGLSIYLLMAIGLKGGVALATYPLGQAAMP
ncbi:MAG: sodium-dependent bicarbonate transport family permease, partial [Alphaproteobacteria bacterium]